MIGRFFRAVRAQLGIALLAAALVWGANSAWGNEPERGGLSPTDVAELSDEQVRKLLLEKLTVKKTGTSREQPFNPATTVWRLQKDFARVRTRAREILASSTALLGVPGLAWTRMTTDRESGSITRFLVAALLALIAAAIVEWFVGNRIAIHTPIPDENRNLPQRAGATATRIALALTRTLVFTIAASVVYFLTSTGDARDQTAFFFYLSAIVIVKLVASMARCIYAPDAPTTRVPQMTDLQAKRLYRALLVTTAFGAFGFFTCALFGTLGVHGDAHVLMLISIGTLTTVLLTTAFIVGREAIASDITDSTEAPSRVRHAFSTIWPWTLVAFIPLLWMAILVTAFLGMVPLYGAALFTVIVLLLAPSIDAALWRHGVSLGPHQPITTAAYRVSRLGLVVMWALALASAWRIDLFAVASQGIGQQAAGALVQVLATLFVAYAAWQIVRIWIDDQITREDKERAERLGLADGETEMGGEGMSRFRTLLPLVKRTIMVVLAGVAALVSLSALGVNTGPILAGAGVVGLAVGFGSQTLVKDIVTGFFFLMEDAFRLGEYVDVGGAKGTVEHIAIRSMKLRHHRGALNTVPFGSVDIIQNFSRDWAIMKLRVRVPFHTDINLVRKLLKRTGQEMLELEEIKDDFIQPFKSQGAVGVDDYGFVISTKFMSKPGRQFVIRRHAFQAMQRAFEEHGIEWARPEIRVAMDDDKEEFPDSIPPAAGAGAAALHIQKPGPAGSE